ncbi:MAG: glycosyltransferase family 39 protein [Chitinophagaceae bacterium]|nr:MAG: glycosyltransferase family 39 protein [Chitinophagaceae bacterium]
MLKRTALLLFFILLKFLIQYQLVDPVYELHRDEFLHLDQARHLAMGYISVPPLSACVGWLIGLLGNSEFWIRFFPALFGALTLLVVWKAMEALKAGLFALCLGATCILFSVLLRLNILFQPNSFDVLAWTFVYYCIIKYIISNHNKWLWWAAIGFAIGMLNKYNIAFQLLGLLPALLLTSQRVIFTKRSFYYSLTLAFLILVPNITWQIQHGFPVLYHMGELTKTQLLNVSRADFLKEQLLFFIGSLFVLIAGFASIFFYRPFKKFTVLPIAFCCTMALFLYLHAKGYYAIGCYPIFIAFGAVWFEHWTEQRWKKYILRPILILLPVLIFIPIIEIAFPVKSPAAIVADAGKQQAMGLHRWEDGKDHPISQDFADMQGWKELTAIVDSAYAAIPDKQHTLVRCDNYGQTGAINYYTSFPGLQALSYNADYIYWFPKNVRWKNIITVKEVNDSDPDRNDERPYFDSIYLAGRIQNEFAREKGTAVYVMLGAADTVTGIISKEVSQLQLSHRSTFFKE